MSNQNDQTRFVAEPVARGFGNLPCPRCGDESRITLDLDDCAQFFCTSCETDFTVDSLRDLFTAWQPVLAWIDTAPRL